MYRLANRSNNDATFIILHERDDFCGVRVVLIAKLLKKCGWPTGWQWAM
jgi:hypothetical protein